jgi:hypothetical protein
MKIEMYTFSICDNAENPNAPMAAKPQIVFRPKRIITNVMARNQVIIEELIYGNIHHLTAPIDAYLLSNEYRKEVIEEFRKSIGCHSLEDMYDYCEKHDLEIPDPGRVMLPTIQPEQCVEVVRKRIDFKPMFILTFFGFAHSPR